MASVDWQKFKSPQHVKAILRHNCKDTREQTKEHTNEHIQHDLTATNTGVWDTYDEAVKRYEERMAELPTPKRKDAVLGVGFCIPTPEGLDEAKEDEWAARVLDVMGEHYGLENIVSYSVHRDEKHEYYDKAKDEMVVSRTHIHGVLVPEIGGRLCAKQVTSRGRMIAINNAIQDMTEKEFGLQWMDGTQQKSRGSTEHLKAESLMAENAMLRERNSELEGKNTELETKNAALEKQVSGLLAPVRAAKRILKSEAAKAAEEAERKAEAANLQREEAEAARQEAEEQARKAVQEAQEAVLERDKAKRDAEAEEARKTALTAENRDLESKRDSAKRSYAIIEQGLQKIAGGQVGMSVGESGVIEYLKATKQYEGLKAQAKPYLKRRIEAQAQQSLDDIMDDAKKRAAEQSGHSRKDHGGPVL